MTGQTPTRERIKTTCPRDCYDACGMIAVKDDGVVRKILGDPEHHVAKGALCGKCAIAYNGVWRDPSARLSQPMKRVGPKGTSSFEEITWDEALDIVADKLTAMAEAGDNAKLIQAHYTGTVGLIGGWYPLRFLSHYAATEVDPDTVCNKAGHVALDYMFGDSLEGFDPEQAKDAATIVVWGANPSHTAPHMHKAWLKDTDAKIIAIDPIAHRTATERADLHLKLKPGTDAALAFGFMHIAYRDGLLDQEFIAKNVVGFDLLASAIDAATPAATAALTGVPEDLIEQAAIAYAKGPSLLWVGQGMQRTRRGGNAFRAVASLAAATGNIGKTGAGICYMNGPASRGIDMDSVVPPSLDRGMDSVSHMDMAAVLADPSKSSAFLHWNCNPLASSPDQAQLRDALMRDDLFHIACDVFPTDTVAYADVVLPAAAFLEFNDIVAPYFHHTLSAQVKVQDAPGTALSNQEIFRRLAAKMGYDDPLLFESDEDLIAKILAQTPFDGTFDDLAAVGTVQLFDAPRLQFADGFSTPSGKVEIASAQAEADGLPLVPEAHADAPNGNGKLRILSPASILQMNSSYANDPTIQEKLGANTVYVHPDDAAAKGIADGDVVTLSNEAGSLTLKVTVDQMTQPGVGVVYKGRWPNAEPTASNVNVLHKSEKSDIAEATSVHNILVDVHVAEAAE